MRRLTCCISTHGSALLDVDSFYGSLQPILVLDKALDMVYCPVMALLNFQMHGAPRSIRSGKV